MASKSNDVGIVEQHLVGALEKVDLNEGEEGISKSEDAATIKDKVRTQISNRMKEQNLLVPFKNHKPDGQLKIPYFVGCEDAAARLARTKEFKEAKVVKVNPSLAQMHLRKLVMKAEKTLVVPVPALNDKVLAHMVPGAEGPKLAQKACTKAGVVKFGQKLTLKDWPKDLKIDFFVVGCVAVTREGVRLGKGKGYAEMEWGVLWSLGVVDENTMVVTTAHEAQVVDTRKLPKAVLARHDLPVDMIVTPSRIINVRNRLDKPKCGIIWSQLKEDDLEEMPVLKSLKIQQNGEN